LKLVEAIHRKLRDQLERSVLLHHTARATLERIQELQLEILEYRLTVRTWSLVTSICLVR
jgi:hypothetical protein